MTVQLFKQYERGLITLDELTDLVPNLAETEWYAIQVAEYEATIREQSWKCRVCGNQNKDGREGDLCHFHAKYPDCAAVGCLDEH